MFKRLKFWMTANVDCDGCCLGCSYFEDCRALYIEEQRAEACNIFPAGEMEPAREIILHPNMNFPSKKVA